MEPVECYAAKKLIDLLSRISDGDSLIDLRNLAVALAAAYGVDTSQAPDLPRPYAYLLLDSVHLPSEEEAREKAWKDFKESFELAVAVLKLLTEKCRAAQGVE